MEPPEFEKLYAVLSLVGSAASGAFSGKPISPHHFIPGEPAPAQDPETQIAICTAIAARQNTGPAASPH